MAIEIYDNAKIVRKNDTFYYFLKCGSKNCFTCPFQSIQDNNFHNHFITRQSRVSDWSIIAIGNAEAVRDNAIADTWWNSPTSSIYGQVRFGNKKNIALYFVKNKNKILDYDWLDETQKVNIDNLINHYTTGEGKEYVIDLANIPEKKRFEDNISYCDKKFNLYEIGNGITYENKSYWTLDNL
jgi:hypothetical protein